MAVLYLITTPLSPYLPAEHLPPVALSIIRSHRIFLAENIRTVRRFIASLKLDIEIDQLEFIEFNKKTKPHELDKLLEPLLFGNDMCLVSEAGAPGVADPGSLAVRWCHESGIQVKPLPGPSSFVLALMASGLTGQQFRFHGYLPIPAGDRVHALRKLEADARKGETQIFMETPYRNDQMLKTITETCAKNLMLCIAVNLTGEDESIQTMSVGDWKKMKVSFHKKPAVFLLG